MPAAKKKAVRKPTERQIKLKKDAIRRARKIKKKIAVLAKDGKLSDGEKSIVVGLVASEILAAQGITKFSVAELN